MSFGILETMVRDVFGRFGIVNAASVIMGFEQNSYSLLNVQKRRIILRFLDAGDLVRTPAPSVE
jgi:hypothetical protein